MFWSQRGGVRRSWSWLGGATSTSSGGTKRAWWNQSRPNRTCRRNPSATATTARFSSSTVQYRAPGSLTGNARIPDPPISWLSFVNIYQPRARHPRRRAAEPVTRPVQATSRNKITGPGEWVQRIHAVFFHQGAPPLSEGSLRTEQGLAGLRAAAAAHLSPAGQLQVATALDMLAAVEARMGPLASS
jgi:hypothetical protein